LIFVKDWNGRFVLVNQATAQVYGTTVDRWSARPTPIQSQRRGIAHFLRHDRDVMSSGQPKSLLKNR